MDGVNNPSVGSSTGSTGSGGTGIPLFSFTTGAMSGAGTYQTFSNIAVNGATTASPLVNMSGASQTFYRFRAINTASNARRAAIQTGTNASLVACYFSAVASSASEVVTANTDCVMDGCVVVGGIIGIKCSGSSATILNTIIDGPSGDAVSMSTAVLTFCGNTAYNAGGNGLIWSGTPSNLCFVANNYFDTLAGAAAVNNNSGTATGLIRCVGNAHYACTPTNGFSDSPLIFSNGVLGGEACTSPDSNFALKSAYYGLGFPGVNQGFENISSYQGYTSFGAVQPNSVSSGGAGGRRPRLVKMGG